MAIVQCPNNHYYDDKRNDTCPYCEKLADMQPFTNELNEQLTSYVTPEDFDDGTQMTEAYGDDVQEFEKTIGIFMDESHNLLTVGWLVCVVGSEKGKSYVINSGRNFAGRSLDMDIILSDDLQIVRDKHFSIVYDPKSLEFYLVSGEGQTYVNNTPITSQIQLSDGDKIQIGQSEYVFVPFCKEGREWN